MEKRKKGKIMMLMMNKNYSEIKNPKILREKMLVVERL